MFATKQHARPADQKGDSKSASNKHIRDDLTLFVHPKTTLKRTKSEANLTDQAQRFNHDSFFNNKRKAAYETHLSQIFLTHVAPFMGVMKQVSCIIMPDIKKMAAEAGLNKDSIATKMHTYFVGDFDLQVLFGKPGMDHRKFYDEILRALDSTKPEDFYKQMCIHRSYITFFTEKGAAKAEMIQANEEKWTTQIDLSQLLSDTQKFRKDAIYFKNNHRLMRTNLVKKTSQDVGVLAPESYAGLSSEDRIKLQGALPTHKPGMFQYFITTAGEFTARGMLDYDLPQTCGPSGMTAMRLALGNQAKLAAHEKQLFDFAVSLYHVAIGAHTVDECFMIANDTDFNDYVRGNYLTIIPDCIKTQNEFQALWIAIQALNARYKDILVTKVAGQSDMGGSPDMKRDQSVKKNPKG